MRKLLVGEAQCRAFQARYYLLEEESETSGSYGVQIEMEDEEASVRDLSPSRQRVEALAEALVRGAVTPGQWNFSKLRQFRQHLQILHNF